ncbi:hypothetical protein [Bowdeniella nasicola]|uniref:hypothetical protein n=1 Tax=Bowdeniella nasicola TaxID=208480 RepID=UPI0011613B47|nr:hypothetical protein [Bowdeniella nasicola]
MYVIDPVTLRERITDQDAFDHELGQLRAAQARGADVRAQLVPMLRIAGFLNDAERMGRDYLGQLDPDVSPARAHAARLRLAHVVQYQGRFEEARQLFDVVVEATAGSLQAFAYQHRGKCLLEEGQETGSLELLKAGLADLETALTMRREMGSDAELIESSALAVNRAQELVSDAPET